MVYRIPYTVYRIPYFGAERYMVPIYFTDLEPRTRYLFTLYNTLWHAWPLMATPPWTGRWGAATALSPLKATRDTVPFTSHPRVLTSKTDSAMLSVHIVASSPPKIR